MFKNKRNKHRKPKFISANSKKTCSKLFTDFIEKQKIINTYKNQIQRKKLINHFVKF